VSALTARKLGMTPRMRWGCGGGAESGAAAGLVVDWLALGAVAGLADGAGGGF